MSCIGVSCFLQFNLCGIFYLAKAVCLNVLPPLFILEMAPSIGLGITV